MTIEWLRVELVDENSNEVVAVLPIRNGLVPRQKEIVRIRDTATDAIKAYRVYEVVHKVNDSTSKRKGLTTQLFSGDHVVELRVLQVVDNQYVDG